MYGSLAQKTICIFLTQLLGLSVCVSAQQNTLEESRPRRVHSDWTKPPSTSPLSLPALTVTKGHEPSIRVALATDATSATISSNGRLLNTTSPGNAMTALEVTRVRLEPIVSSPLTNTKAVDYLLKVDGSASRSEADDKARELFQTVGKECQIAYEPELKSWSILIKAGQVLEEATELRARLEVAGLDTSLIKPSMPPVSVMSSEGSGRSGPVRLTSRLNLAQREVVAFSAKSVRLFGSSSPVQFASQDEGLAPVKFNDRAYRGRIEVFTNSRGTLTVVNVLGLEDYVRGVIANELSPTGYPSLEALKAQAIAARTYALKNRGQFMAQGFDLLPTTRSQVYRGLSSEHHFSTRAVDETRGIIATFDAEPINALYTSTCGGRTENAENIFGQAVPYLTSHECGVEGLDTFKLTTNRPCVDVHEEVNLPLVRQLALLAVHNFGGLPGRLSDGWLKSPASAVEIRSWLSTVARTSRQNPGPVSDDVTKPAAFATALNLALYGEKRADVLLNNADVEYHLAFRDARDIPAGNRSDVALLLREGYLSLHADATFRVHEQLTRARVLKTIARAWEAQGLFQLQKGSARSVLDGSLVVRVNRGKDQTIRVAPDAFIFRRIGDDIYPVQSVAIVGGEPLTFHLNASGEVDYLEVYPAPRGAAADRFSPFANWIAELSIEQIRARLSRRSPTIGAIQDLRIVQRGPSRRVTELEIVGTRGSTIIRGGRIRSLLGLREQLFVIDRKYDSALQVAAFVFTGRGWGHGVGMCQVGAYGLSRQGLTFDQILKTYYAGIELRKLY